MIFHLSFHLKYPSIDSLGIYDQGHPVCVKHDALMHHGQNRGSKKT